MNTEPSKFKIVPSILELETLILKKDVSSLYLKKCKDETYYVEVVTKDSSIMRTKCFEKTKARNIYTLLASLLTWKKNINYGEQEYSG